MSQKRIAQAIEPFNEVFYKGCFYNSVFPAILSLDKRLLPFLINDVIAYDAAKLRRTGLPDVQYLPVRDVDAILAEEGVLCDVKRVCEDVVAEIKQALDRDRPVLLWVDCFYESIRTDAFQKNHWEHTLLFYGYDDRQEEFQIIEHQHRDNLSYQKMTIPYADVVNAYQGFLQQFYLDQQFPTFYEFYVDPNQTGSSGIETLRAHYVANLQTKNDLIRRGIRYLELFVGTMGQAVQEQGAFPCDLEELIASLNNIINTKQVENYRLRELQMSEDVIRLMDTIVEHWTFLRATIVKFYYSSVFRPESFEKAIGRLRTLIDLETQWVDALQR